MLALCDILLRIVLCSHCHPKSCVMWMPAPLLAHEAPTVIRSCMVLIVLWKCTLFFLSMRYGFTKAGIPKTCVNTTNLWFKVFYTCLRQHEFTICFYLEELMATLQVCTRFQRISLLQVKSDVKVTVNYFCSTQRNIISHSGHTMPCNIFLLVSRWFLCSMRFPLAAESRNVEANQRFCKIDTCMMNIWSYVSYTSHTYIACTHK